MMSRKDLIKRSLGITEYPWSSDDELEAATHAVEETSLRRPPAEPRTSAADAPGPSGLPSAMSQQQHQHQMHQIQQQQSQQDQSRRNQTRQARDLFWSIINSPDRTSQGHTRPRSSDMLYPRPAASREASRRAAAGAGRGAARPAPDVQRIMEFKRLTRNIGSQQHRSLHTLPLGRMNNGVIMMSDGSATVVGRCYPHLVPPSPQRPVRVQGGLIGDMNSGRESPVTSPPPDLSTSRRWDELRGRSSVPRAAPEPPPEPRSPVVVRSDEDEDETARAEPSRVPDPVFVPAGGLPTPPTAHPDGHRLSTLQEENEEADVAIHEAAGSSGNVTLEEEIVAVDLESASDQIPPQEGDGAGTPSPVGAADDTDGRYVPELRRSAAHDDTVATSSGASGDAAPPQPIQGVKRKRRDSDDNVEPGSVKEFNQSLLRLLECPVCLEWMEPPMSQCRRGHLVCVRCRARLASCPVCRTTFSSVRNRAMEGVAELVRFPCRHGCGREVRLRRRAPHEASCAARHYHCPAPVCADTPPLPRADLAQHFQSQHLTMMKIGRRHKFSMKVNSEQHDTWLILAMEEYFHLRIDVDIRTWGVVVYVSYIGPMCDAKNYTYEVTIDVQHNQRKLVYTRATHSDLESSNLNVSRQDCFHLTLDQALNYIRFKNRHCISEKYLDFNLQIAKAEPPAALDESDS